VEQWVRAFHGDRSTRFPWGDDFVADRVNTYENKVFKNLSPVTDTPNDVSPFGVYNLVGNAREMTRNTTRSNNMDYVVMKGGCGNNYGRVQGVYAYRSLMRVDESDASVGFRCVYEERSPAAPGGGAP
jgi:formylglycine-generating enzyme required for sulfatase activity